MRYRTITAQHDDTCRRCSAPILAGSKVRWGGTGRIYHIKADCPATGGPTRTRRRGPIDSTLGAYLSYLDSSGAYTADGTFLGRTNPRGRCEDAPCCGCCT